MRILVIEDNRDILANVLDYLQLKGFSVDCAQDGLSGLHLACTGHYDLIVLDIMLPGMDGYQVCKRLREDGRNEVPILMLTARDALDDRLTRACMAGADDYLIKPFALSELVARIEAILRRSQGSRKRQLKVADLTYDLDTLHVSRAGQPLKLNPHGPQAAGGADAEKPGRGPPRGAGGSTCGGTTARTATACAAISTSCARCSTSPSPTPLLHTLHGVGYRLAETARWRLSSRSRGAS